jgi:hypothetical protein
VVVPETDTDKAFRKTAKSFIRYSPKQERIIILFFWNQKSWWDNKDPEKDMLLLYFITKEIKKKSRINTLLADYCQQEGLYRAYSKRDLVLWHPLFFFISKELQKPFSYR